MTSTQESKGWILCPMCDCPMLPKGKKKKKNEYDHASGCPLEGMTASQVYKPKALILITVMVKRK